MPYSLQHTTTFLRFATSRIKRLRFHNPLVQVWMLAGFSLIFSLFLRSPAGEKPRNSFAPGSAAGLLLRAGGPAVDWSDAFGAQTPPDGEWPPEIRLPAAEIPPAPESLEKALILDGLRPEMEKAARRPWRFLNHQVRETINAVSVKKFAAIQVSAAWSGAAAGDARLVIRRDPVDGGNFDFIIGNGSRSADGAVEPGAAWTARSLRNNPALERLQLCFIGENTGSLTPAQQEAAGELLNYLEARFGRIIAAEKPEPEF